MSRNFDLFDGIQPEREPFHAAATGEHAPEVAPLLPISSRWRKELEKVVTRLYLLPDSPSPAVLVFLAMDQDSAPRVSAHCSDLLAARVAASVCYVEADPDTPSVREELGMAPRGGLADLLMHEDRQVESVVSRIPGRNVWLLPWGFPPRLANSAVRFERLRDCVTQLRGRFPFVLIEAPPPRSGSDALAFAQLADGVVLTLRTRATPREAARKLKGTLADAGVSVLGTILTDQFSPVPEALRRF
jgi:receptor protein-tyrosine kinase